MRSVVIVGASLAGSSAASALRERGFDGHITLVGDETHRPYRRPPLSKELLTGALARPRLDLNLGGLEADWWLGTAARSLDLARRELALDDGRRLRFDGLVIATGARARKPAWHVPLEGVYTLRSVDDAIALRAHVLARPRTVAVVGAGFIGSETAASLRTLGCDVTLIDVDRLPMQRVLGATLGELCARLHRDHGVRLALGVGVAGLVGTGAVEGVRLADGRMIAADTVVLGIGALPNTEWLQESGLDLADGVACDEQGRVLGADAVVAAGDVARWDSPRHGPLRVEHWDHAIAQAEIGAAALLAGPGAGPQPVPLPFFWSDQYDAKLQLIGVPGPCDVLRVVEGTLDSPRFVALFERDGRASAAFLWRSPHRLMAYRRRMDEAQRITADAA